ELLEFIGHKLPLDKMEELFATYEDLGRATLRTKG
ncbi:hypothetical protein PF011_g32733, partial [Phytophthora fragariae]